MMPNICSQKDTPCVLLHRMEPGGELKEVAEGSVMQPSSREMHNNRMSNAVMRARLTRVLPEFSAIDPPCNLREPTSTCSLESAPSGSCNGRRPKFILGG